MAQRNTVLINSVDPAFLSYEEALDAQQAHFGGGLCVPRVELCKWWSDVTQREFVFLSYQLYVYSDRELGCYFGINISLHVSLVTACVHFIYLYMIVMVIFISNPKRIYIQKPIIV